MVSQGGAHDAGKTEFDCRDGSECPLLSIVCAVRNGLATMPALLKSYAAQRTEETELVVIDAASTDRTWSLVVANRGLISTALSEPDQGIYDAWNKAIRRCRGRYVAFIGCDDRLAPGALTNLLDAMRTAIAGPPTQAPHVIAGYNVLTRNGMPVSLLGEIFKPATLPRRMMIAHVMAAHRLDWLLATGGYDASFSSSGDYAQLLSQRRGLQVVTLPSVLAYMEDGGTSRRTWLPHRENFRARRTAGLSLAYCTVMLARAVVFTGLRWMRLK